MTRSLTEAGTERRRQILAAALAVFSEAGFEHASVDEIRRRSGASIGSIYHFFGSKDEIAAALFVEGLRQYHAGLQASLRAKHGAAALVKGVVAYHLDWVEAYADWARFLIDMRRSAAVLAAEAEINALNRQNYAALFSLFEPHFASGALVKLPRAEFVAVVFGPAHELARLRLRGGGKPDVSSAKKRLAEAAWRAVRSDQKG